MEQLKHYIKIMETILMNKEQVLNDLQALKRKYLQVWKYYPLSDKDFTRGNFEEIIEDLTKYITIELK